MPATLLSLPLELREIIYEEVFSSFTVRHGFRTSSSNRTALFQTCKQIHREAWRHLPLNARFHFRGTETMLDTLMSVDQAVVTRIRHIRIKSFPFPLYNSGRPDYYPTYNFCNALSLLPGLHLEQLVVEDSFHGFGLVDTWRDVVTYFDIESLLKCDAWKELVYITPNTDFLTSGYDHRKKRVAQPENWDALLKERDGEASGADVQMWIAAESSNGTAKESAEPRLWSAQPGHLVIEDASLATPDQDVRGEVHIVARRGRGAAYVQTGLTQNKSWKELKSKEGGFSQEGWAPYYNDMADAIGWIYGGWGRRMQLANTALNY
ncbi:hypothetical protein BU23DRAFT_453038 [Bimuria novae-zelandiae CBS 107.79]|uniref:F-box domain-containing protein n=1 Tax=Bimuria novae-zelandiae CBS 107.79 TaxID=1447943 RepID=A0A6A5VJV8_9PLEO|nr:hypothetical protein BU23DRAFT_453038 [Bimuria novae-zelandiae CBS 107.79]